MPKLFVIAGHGDGDPGAGGWLDSQWFDEAERVRALARRIADLGGGDVEVGDTSRNWYADALINEMDDPGCPIVELHMDSATGARGGHVIYCGNVTPTAQDDVLAGKIAEMFPGRANSLVGRTDLANPNRAAARGFDYRLVENGFISSPEDLAVFNDSLDDLARIYLDVFGITAEASSGTRHANASASTLAYIRRLLAPLLIRAGIPECEGSGLDLNLMQALVKLWQVYAFGALDTTLMVSGSIGTQSQRLMDAHPVSLGDAGAAAWALKAALVARGYTGALVDGGWHGLDLTNQTFDAVAEGACKAFQGDWGCPATGVGDAPTWCTLLPSAVVDRADR
jgi:hypothetical protein